MPSNITATSHISNISSLCNIIPVNVYWNEFRLEYFCRALHCKLPIWEIFFVGNNLYKWCRWKDDTVRIFCHMYITYTGKSDNWSFSVPADIVGGSHMYSYDIWWSKHRLCNNSYIKGVYLHKIVHCICMAIQKSVKY